MKKIEFYFSEKLKYKKFEFWDIFLLLVAWIVVTMVISIFLLLFLHLLVFHRFTRLIVYSMSMGLIWIELFKVTKKYLLKWKCIIIKEDLDKILSFVVCVGLICTVILSFVYFGEQSGTNQQFVDNFLIVIFGTVPSTLIKPYFINDNRLVQERKQIYKSRRNRFYY